MQNARFGVHKGFASLQSVPATCMEVSQACKVSLQAAWRFRRLAKCPCNLHGGFARLQCVPATCMEGLHVCKVLVLNFLSE